MKGFAMLGINSVGWIEKEKPGIGPMDALVRPIALAPCTSDVHTVWEGSIGERTNMILGHEAVGEVVETGSLVNDFRPGDKVIIPAITPNWSSPEAQAGYSMHSEGMLSGWRFSNFKDGVFGEYFHVNDADGNLAILPTGLSPAEACMLSDMIPTGVHGAELARLSFGDTVLVIGIGPVGLMAVAACAIRGAARIIGVGSRPNCIQIAKEYGANEIINYKDGPIVDQVMELTGEKGVDRVIIAGGNNDTFIDAVKVLKPGGIIGNVNYIGCGDYVRIPRAEWGCGMGHKTISGGLMPGGRLRLEKLSALLVNYRIDASKLITHTFKGFDKIEEALLLMKNKPADLIKPVVLMN